MLSELLGNGILFILSSWHCPFYVQTEEVFPLHNNVGLTCMGRECQSCEVEHGKVI